MFSYEERLKAVKLLLQYDMSYSTVIRGLGYPSSGSLRNWYYEYRKEGELHRDFDKKTKYSKEEKQIAVDYYIEHGVFLEQLKNSATLAVQCWINGYWS